MADGTGHPRIGFYVGGGGGITITSAREVTWIAEGTDDTRRCIILTASDGQEYVAAARNGAALMPIIGDDGGYSVHIPSSCMDDPYMVTDVYDFDNPDYNNLPLLEIKAVLKDCTYNSTSDMMQTDVYLYCGSFMVARPSDNYVGSPDTDNWMMFDI